MESMTGYTFLERSSDQFSFSVELKSLNSRYLEIFLNIPKVLRNDENKIHNLLKSYFSRGKIEFNIDIFDWISTKPISLNNELIKKYYKELMKIHESLKIKEPLRFESILTLEGISQRERAVISEISNREIYNTIDTAIKKTIEMRKKEGNIIKKDLINQMSLITNSVNLIKKLSKKVLKERRDILKNKIESIAGCKIDDARVYSEMAILVDKLDINEELVRLNDHLLKFKLTLQDNDQIGKKIDFLAQEMFREINTISSKSNSSEISHIVVDVKNYIDKIREHSRNIV